jgi:hypothetical protein
MAKNEFKFLDSKIYLREDKLVFEKGLLQKLNQIGRRISTPESIKLEDILTCKVKDNTKNPADKPELIINHKDGREVLKCNKGVAHKFTSKFGYDGKEGAERLSNQFESENKEDELVKDL